MHKTMHHKMQNERLLLLSHYSLMFITANYEEKGTDLSPGS